MKKVVVFLLICLPSLMSFSQTLQDSIAKQNSIKELFHLMQQDSIMEKTFSLMLPSMINQIKRQFPTADSATNVLINELMKSASQTMKDISKKMIEEDMVKIYNKYFSQEDINDFVSFYKSPSGQKLLSVTPDISEDVMMIMRQKYIPEIQKTIKEKVEEIKNSEIK